MAGGSGTSCLVSDASFGIAVKSQERWKAKNFVEFTILLKGIFLDLNYLFDHRWFHSLFSMTTLQQKHMSNCTLIVQRSPSILNIAWQERWWDSGASGTDLTHHFHSTTSTSTRPLPLPQPWYYSNRSLMPSKWYPFRALIGNRGYLAGDASTPSPFTLLLNLNPYVYCRREYL